MDYICASVKYAITPQDSTFFLQKNNHFAPTKYPQSPLPIRNETFEKYNEDTLFFIFYFHKVLFSNLGCFFDLLCI